MTLIDHLSDDPELSARQIAERILEATRRGLMENRFDMFRACIAIPTRIETFEASRQIETEEELREVFEAVRRYHASRRVTHLDRRCVEADFSGPGRISFTYETRLLEGPRLVQEPYPVMSDAVLDAGRWKVVRSSYAIVDQPQHIKALIGRG